MVQIMCIGIKLVFESTPITKCQNDEVYILRSIIISCHLESSKCKLAINHLSVNPRGFCAGMPRCFTKLLMLKTTHKERLHNSQEFVQFT